MESIVSRITPPPAPCLLFRELDDRPDLDAADAGRRNLRGDLDGIVEVARLDEIIPAELFLRLGEGPIGRRELAVPDADRRCGRNGLQRLASDVVAALLDAVGEREILAHEGITLALRHRFDLLLVVVDQAQ